MKIRIARKVVKISGYTTEVRMMPYSCVRHRGGTIQAAVKEMQSRGEDPFPIRRPR